MLGAVVATVGLIFSDPGDDAARASYAVSLVAAATTALLLPMLLRRRRIEIVALRADAAVLVFQLRAQAVALAGSATWPAARLAVALRDATALAFRARRLTETLARAGVEQETIDLRVALEAVEASLTTGEKAG